MIEGKGISAMLPKAGEKLFNSGVIIPAKRKLCNKCTDKLTCINCNNQINENKAFEANSNLLKPEPPY